MGDVDSTTSTSRPRTCCWVPAASRSRSRASTSSASATRRARWRLAATPTNAPPQHAGVRKQFGRPLCEFQGLQWKFADMAVKLDSGQLLLYRAAINADRGLPSADDTAVAKVACNTSPASKSPPRRSRSWARRATARHAGRVVLAPVPRLDDRRRLGGSAEEPHRRARLRTAVRPTAAEAEIRGGRGMTRRKSPRLRGGYSPPLEHVDWFPLRP